MSANRVPIEQAPKDWQNANIPALLEDKLL